jgi:hypothetical protein
MVFFLAIYGLIYGFLTEKELVEGATAGLWLLVKIPITLILTVLFSLPTLYIITRAFGGKLSGRNLFSSMVVSFSAASLVLLAILPLNILYVLTNHSPITIHVLSIIISMIVCAVYLFRSYIILGKMSPETASLTTIISAIILLFILIQFTDLLFEISATPYTGPSLVGGFAHRAVQEVSIVR